MFLLDLTVDVLDQLKPQPGFSEVCHPSVQPCIRASHSTQSHSHMLWRARLSLEYLHALRFVQSVSTADYILMLEDDAIPGYSHPPYHDLHDVQQLPSMRRVCCACWRASTHGATCRCGRSVSRSIQVEVFGIREASY